jgi:hypothetical protein
MQTQANGKVRRTATEWDAIFKEFEASGLSAAVFCRRKKIPKSTFTKRHQSRGRKIAVRRSSAARFVELKPASVDISPPLRATLDRREFEIEMPGGVVLRWRA